MLLLPQSMEGLVIGIMKLEREMERAFELSNAMAKEAPDAAIFVIAETSDGHVHCAVAAALSRPWAGTAKACYGACLRAWGEDTLCRVLFEGCFIISFLSTRLRFKALRRRSPVQNYSESFFTNFHSQFLTTTFCVLSPAHVFSLVDAEAIGKDDLAIVP